jgi:hypothetical protein
MHIPTRDLKRRDNSKEKPGDQCGKDGENKSRRVDAH